MNQLFGLQHRSRTDPLIMRLMEVAGHELLFVLGLDCLLEVKRGRCGEVRIGLSVYQFP